MSFVDPIGDMITRIRNAQMRALNKVSIPNSKLRSRILDREIFLKDQERAKDRKSQVGSGDRSERIRTYNFPQGRISDHRINLTLYKLNEVLEGSLDEIINPLISDNEASKIFNLNNE